MSFSSPVGSPPTPETPGVAEIAAYFSGAWQMMLGRREGLHRLDLSADGFWTSFFAVAVALPPMALSWIEYEGVERRAPVAEAGVAVVYGAHALADIAAWIVPVLVLLLVARRVGLERWIVPLVVATNWGNALLAWAMAPAELLVLASHGATPALLLALLASLASLALMVRLVAVSLDDDLKLAAGVCVGIVVASLVSYGVVMDLTGIALL